MSEQAQEGPAAAPLSGIEAVRAAIAAAQPLDFTDDDDGADDAGDGGDPGPDDAGGYQGGDIGVTGRADPLDLRLAMLPRNDLGNAGRLLARYGEGLIYLMDVGWISWDGTRWVRQHGDYIARLRAQDTGTTIKEEAQMVRGHFRLLDAAEARAEAQRLGIIYPGFKGDAEELGGMVLDHAKKLDGWSVQTGNATRTAAMLTQAEPKRRRDISDMDAQPYLVNFRNGTLELHRGKGGKPPHVKFREHDPLDLLTRQMGCDWRGDLLADMLEGGCGSEWERVLGEIQPDEHNRAFLRRWFGYVVGGPPDEQAMLVMSGGGSNGKSLVVETIMATMGDYALLLPIESLMQDDARRGSEARPDLVELPGRRLALASEPEGGVTFSSGMIKQLTERQEIRVRQLMKAFISFVPQHRLVVQCNEKPKVKGADYGTWRRIKVLHFWQKWVKAHELHLPENKGARVRDDDLPHRLLQHLEVVAVWLVAGWLDYAEQGLADPIDVLQATEAYRVENDTIGEFLRDRVMDAPGRHISGREMYEAYQRWCEEGGIVPWNGTNFGRAVGARLKKRTSGTVQYVDVTFRPGTW